MTMLRQLTSYLLLALLGAISLSASAQPRDEVVFFFNDALGSAVAAINEQGDLCWSEEYTGYGDKTINDDLVSPVGCGIIGEERGFTGHTEDVNSDLVYMQQRYYDPSIGRFLSIDPLDADPTNPMTYNRYMYGNNNPYKFIDPDGRSSTHISGDNDSDGDGIADSADNFDEDSIVVDLTFGMKVAATGISGQINGGAAPAPARVATGDVPKRTGPKGVDPAHHNANVMVKDANGNVVSHERLVSGNMTPAEKALGFPKGTNASHTEARAVTNTRLNSGDTMTITGQRRPCNSCKG